MSTDTIMTMLIFIHVIIPMIIFLITMIVCFFVDIWNDNVVKELHINFSGDIIDYVMYTTFGIMLWPFALIYLSFKGFAKLCNMIVENKKKNKYRKECVKDMKVEADLIRRKRIAWCTTCEDGWCGSIYDLCPTCHSDEKSHIWVEIP